jgi:hypothetical protein
MREHVYERPAVHFIGTAPRPRPVPAWRRTAFTQLPVICNAILAAALG